jgi:hypothetical protein
MAIVKTKTTNSLCFLIESTKKKKRKQEKKHKKMKREKEQRTT